MINDLMKIFAYTVVFTVFNLCVFVIYRIAGNVIFRKTAKKINHSPLPIEQIEYLQKIDFENVQHKFVTQFGKRMRVFSILYIIFSEIVCLIALLVSERYVLVCRVALLIDIFLVLLFIFLLIFFKIKSKKLASEHQKKLCEALASYQGN